ncbi:MAG: hypothetical protein AB7K24_08915, partial [Gemmataceae bacterium]
IPPLRSLRPEVPPELQAIYERMVAKKVEDRYQSMAEVIAALEGCQTKLAAITTKPDAKTHFPAPGSTDANAETQAEYPSGSVTQAGLRSLAGGRKNKRLLLAAGGGSLALAALVFFMFAGGNKNQPSPATPDQPVAVDKDADWIKAVQAMPPEKQVEAVTAKLKELNPAFAGTTAHSIQMGVVAVFTISDDKATLSDASPVRALTGLRRLSCYGTAIKDLSFLQGMKLQDVRIYGGPLSSLEPLRGMKSLRKVELHRVFDLRDLAPLKGLELNYLQCWETGISDLTPLAGMPLSYLELSVSPIASLSPLKGMPLATFKFSRIKVTDWTPLAGLPLVELEGNFKAADAGLLRSIKALQKINGKPAAEYLKNLGALPRGVDDIGIKSVQKQVEAVTAKLKELNPGFDGKVEPTIDGGAGALFHKRQAEGIRGRRALTGIPQKAQRSQRAIC